MSISPKVSVAMSVHNGQKYLRQAMDSVLSQTFSDLEFLIVDDGSTDGTAAIVSAYDDPRITLISNSVREGLTNSLNKALDRARGEYIARMDSDDVCTPTRFEKQVAFLDRHRDVAVCGTWATNIDSEGKAIGVRRTPVGDELECYYWRPSPIIHPTAMIRSSALAGKRYDPQFRYAQDFDLWLRLKRAHRIANLPEPLLLYRVHDQSITGANNPDQLKTAYEIFCKNTDVNTISQEEFLALLPVAYSLSPLKRARAKKNLARSIGQPYRSLFADDVRYTRMWLRNLAYVILCKIRARSNKSAATVKSVG